jgi:hypothetical protein
MELFLKDFVPELNTKNLGNSSILLTITHMTLSAKRFRSYEIFMIDVAAKFCSWTEQRLNGCSISSLRLAKYHFVIQLSQLSDGPSNNSKRLAICELQQSKT